MVSLLLLGALLQQPQQPLPAKDQPRSSSKGQILFERHSDDTPAATDTPATPQLHSRISSSNSTPPTTDDLRSAIQITQYDLDLHLNIDTGDSEVRARIRVQNRSASPLNAVTLQVTSSMQWESARQKGADLKFTQQPVDTDSDHTGTVTEMVAALAESIAPGASTQLDLFYNGPLVENADRLIALGATDAQAAVSEWDGFNTSHPVSGIRGFGNVVWYPVSETPTRMGDGNRLLKQVGQARVAISDLPFRLRLTVEAASPLTTAFFCGEAMPLKATDTEPSTPENTTLPLSGAPHLYTAEWKLSKTGLRAPSLFLSSVEGTTPSSNLLVAYTDRPQTISSYNSAASALRGYLQTWFGAEPLRKLQLLDLGGRSALPFEDGATVVLPMQSRTTEELLPGMTQWLTHAWFRAGQSWMTDGLAEFVQQVWAERQAQGTRDEAARVSQDQDALRALALYDPEEAAPNENAAVSSSSPAERTPLTHCAEPICYRTKGAAVWRMLRFLVGEDTLQQALLSLHNRPQADAEALQEVLEKISGKDLSWFFQDWVYHDRGLADLSIVAIAPRPLDRPIRIGPQKPGEPLLPEQPNKPTGWIVAVEVRNHGGAAAEVPVILHGAAYDSKEHLRIPGHSVATVRILVPAAPDTVQVNDGTVPEVTISQHTRAVSIEKR